MGDTDGVWACAWTWYGWCHGRELWVWAVMWAAMEEAAETPVSSVPPLLGGFYGSSLAALRRWVVLGQPGSKLNPGPQLHCTSLATLWKVLNRVPIAYRLRAEGACDTQRHVPCFSIQTVSSRSRGPRPYIPLHTVHTVGSNECYLVALGWFSFSSLLALTPKLPCCWVGEFKWKSTCGHRTLLPVRSSGVGGEKERRTLQMGK